jgi:hypothetical protein
MTFANEANPDANPENPKTAAINERTRKTIIQVIMV